MTNISQASSTLAAAGTASLIGLRPIASDAEPPPETTRIRLARVPTICRAPQYMTEELLHGEGFTDVQYVKIPLPQVVKSISAGEIDFSADTAP